MRSLGMLFLSWWRNSSEGFCGSKSFPVKSWHNLNPKFGSFVCFLCLWSASEFHQKFMNGRGNCPFLWPGGYNQHIYPKDNRPVSLLMTSTRQILDGSLRKGLYRRRSRVWWYKRTKPKGGDEGQREQKEGSPGMNFLHFHTEPPLWRERLENLGMVSPVQEQFTCLCEGYQCIKCRRQLILWDAGQAGLSRSAAQNGTECWEFRKRQTGHPY